MDGYVASTEEEASSRRAGPRKRRRVKLTRLEQTVILFADDGMKFRRPLPRRALDLAAAFGDGLGRLAVAIASLAARVVAAACKEERPDVELCHMLAHSTRTGSWMPTHYVDFYIEDVLWLDVPKPELSHADWVAGRQKFPSASYVFPDFDVYGPSARAARQGTGIVTSYAVHAEYTKRVPKWVRPCGISLEDVRGAPMISQDSVVSGPAALIDPKFVVKWIRATRHFRNLVDLKGKLEDVVDVVECRLLETYGDGQTQHIPSRWYLFLARPRFDFTMMLMNRRLAGKTHLSSSPVGYLYNVDGSPASGWEMLTIVQNVLHREASEWRQMPVVYLSFGCQGLRFKLFAFLWSLFLELGPQPMLFRWHLSQVLLFCTDRGIERNMADSFDCLGDLFCRHRLQGDHPAHTLFVS